MLQNLGPKERMAALVIACITLFGITFVLSSHIRRAGSVELHTAPLISSGPKSNDLPLAPDAPAAKLAVDVEGAVAHPGVYRLSVGSTAFDAIFAAGGVLPDAGSYDKMAPVADKQRLEIPFIGHMRSAPAEQQLQSPPTLETQNPPTSRGSKKALPAEGSISINSGTVMELAQLPGIGPTEAQRIIDYRLANGPFGSIDDLRNVKGIGEKKWQKLEPYVKL